MTKETLLERIKTDHGYHEVIPMMNNKNVLRVYIDIDVIGGDPTAILTQSLEVLNAHFKTLDTDWAICSCNRAEGDKFKISFHIMSTKYSMQLNNMRALAKQMPTLKMDESVYWFDINDHEDNGYMRLPNQTKNSINKPAPPLEIIQGHLSDFLVTDTTGLTEFSV